MPSEPESISASLSILSYWPALFSFAGSYIANMLHRETDIRNVVKDENHRSDEEKILINGGLEKDIKLGFWVFTPLSTIFLGLPALALCHNRLPDSLMMQVGIYFGIGIVSYIVPYEAFHKIIGEYIKKLLSKYVSDLLKKDASA